MRYELYFGYDGEGGAKMNGIKRYINENYDTGFLTPEVNFALAIAAYVLAALGFIFGA